MKKSSELKFWVVIILPIIVATNTGHDLIGTFVVWFVAHFVSVFWLIIWFVYDTRGGDQDG
ncbi:MAG: hypothetical protein ACK42D_01170 [Candidatus Paceibacteria bacterium]